jgi:hypothetical protein
MTDTRSLLERQAEWQKQRTALTWPEKIRMAEAVRESAAKLRRDRSPSGTVAGPRAPGSETPETPRNKVEP